MWRCFFKDVAVRFHETIEAQLGNLTCQHRRQKNDPYSGAVRYVAVIWANPGSQVLEQLGRSSLQ
jgi:hypothetical protein